MSEIVKLRLQITAFLLLFLGAVFFLLKLAYMPIWFSTPLGLLMLIAFRYLLDATLGLKVPLSIILLMMAALEVDALGNYFDLYNQRFRLVQYDELAHCFTSGLVVPPIVWLTRVLLYRFGVQIPLGLICFFTFTIVFMLAGFYEVIELWDDKYFHPEPGWRIHGSYDTANDLQWDLMGMGVGAILSYFLLRGTRRDEVLV